MPLHILVLDDAYDAAKPGSNFRILERIIQSACGQENKPTIYFTNSPKQALTHIANNRVDLFICDGSLGEIGEREGYPYGHIVVHEMQKQMNEPRRTVAWSATLEETLTIGGEEVTCEQAFRNLGVTDCFKKHGYKEALEGILNDLAKPVAPIARHPVTPSKSCPSFFDTNEHGNKRQPPNDSRPGTPAAA